MLILNLNKIKGKKGIYLNFISFPFNQLWFSGQQFSLFIYFLVSLKNLLTIKTKSVEKGFELKKSAIVKKNKH